MSRPACTLCDAHDETMKMACSAYYAPPCMSP